MVHRGWSVPSGTQRKKRQKLCEGEVLPLDKSLLTLQRRLVLTLRLSPDIYFYLLTTVSGGRGCYRRVGRQTRRMLFPSLRSPGAISTLFWTNSVGSTRPFAHVLPGRN